MTITVLGKWTPGVGTKDRSTLVLKPVYKCPYFAYSPYVVYPLDSPWIDFVLSTARLSIVL